MNDREYIVDDPELGFVSCEDEAHARKYAKSVDGKAGYRDWSVGEPCDPVWF